MALNIILNESFPLPQTSITTLLSGAADYARKQTPSALEEKFTFPLGTENSAPEQIELGMIGGIFVDELTWADVVVVVQGLQRFYEESGKRFALIFYLGDERHGSLGDGYLELTKGEGAGG